MDVFFIRHAYAIMRLFVLNLLAMCTTHPRRDELYIGQLEYMVVQNQRTIGTHGTRLIQLELDMASAEHRLDIAEGLVNTIIDLE